MKAKDTLFYNKNTLNIGGMLFTQHEPLVMGVLNVTPDSFYDGGTIKSDKELIKRAERQLSEGAFCLDIGGYSSRPGAKHISESEEAKRIVPAIKAIVKAFPNAVLSIDTFRSKVARQALDAGAAIVNDISGGEQDDKMFEVAAEYGAALILMHMRGTPQNMSQNTQYENLVREVITFLRARIVKARSLGVSDIIVDPGFGFSKTIDQNYILLSRLSELLILDVPILAGISRKSMIYKVLEVGPEEALTGTNVLNTLALLNGASILRVHDVKDAVETIKLITKFWRVDTII